ncbi:hypothetical protein [Kistimonas asteriae]|uniref:hypothetical protein n=1 Tax=Kistimonas asteriae TaxID=517724 RepID=UPI001BA7C087|nr:hypothetical protein [Kistimonas asteriae]
MRLNGPSNKPQGDTPAGKKAQSETQKKGLGRDGRKIAPSSQNQSPPENDLPQKKPGINKPSSVKIDNREAGQSSRKGDTEKPADWLDQVRDRLEQAHSEEDLQALLDECRQQGRDLHPIHALVDDKAMSLLQTELDSQDNHSDMAATVARYRPLIKAPRKRRRADHLPDQILNNRKVRANLHPRQKPVHEQTSEYDTMEGDTWKARNQYLEQLVNEKDEAIGQASTVSEREHDDDDDVVIGGSVGARDVVENSLSASFDKKDPAYNYFQIKLQNMEKYSFTEAVDVLCEDRAIDPETFLNGVTHLLDEYIVNHSRQDYDDVTLGRLQALISQGGQVVTNHAQYGQLEQNIMQAAAILTRNAMAGLDNAEVLLAMKGTFETMLFHSGLSSDDQWNYFTMVDQPLSERLQAMGEKTGWQADFQRLFTGQGAELSFMKLLSEAGSHSLKRAQLEAMVQVKEDLWEDLELINSELENPTEQDQEIARKIAGNELVDNSDLEEIAAQVAYYRHMDSRLECQEQLSGWSGEFTTWCREQLERH